jgi:phospholipase/carboxylesterase
MPAKLTGPRLEAKSGRAKQLVVLLHGYGASGDDLIDLAQHWRPLLPDAAFVSPHAHELCPGAPGGRQWFALSAARGVEDARASDERYKGAEAAKPVIDAFIDEELAKYSLDDSRLAICGFSQGAMMTLHVGLRRKRAPAALVGFSGLLVGPERLAEATARDLRGAPPPILLVHGDQDPIIPVDAMFVAADQLAAADLPTQWHLAVGVGHGIDGGALRHAGLFLAKAFGIAPPKR